MDAPNCEITINEIKAAYTCAAHLNEPIGAVLRLTLPDAEGKEYALLTMFDPDTGTARVFAFMTFDTQRRRSWSTAASICLLSARCWDTPVINRPSGTRTWPMTPC